MRRVECPAGRPRRIERAFDAIDAAARRKLLYAALLLVCAAAAACRLGAGGAPQAGAFGRAAAAPEWPTQWDGRALRPLALSEVERRFAAQFPGAIARLGDGERQIVMRRVDEPTRMLHPAVDCYRALGFRIDAVRLEADAQARRWRCFDAVRDGQRLRVCERITDADGAEFTDTSAWYWAALLGRSHGPWQAVTTARALP